MAESNDDKWCFAWYEDPAATTEGAKAALQKSAKWDGNVISVSFLEGTEEQKALVRRHAEEWTRHCNIQFSWQDPPRTDIRISFRPGGSWSVVGKTARDVRPRSRATMNYGWLNPGISEENARAVVLHEFGHALGLIHEHQNPLGEIKWNQPAVIRDLSGPPNNWDMKTIFHNMFDPHKRNKIDGTELDKSSIMMYPIPAAWLAEGEPVGFNHQLSERDREFIARAYP